MLEVTLVQTVALVVIQVKLVVVVAGVLLVVKVTEELLLLRVTNVRAVQEARL